MNKFVFGIAAVAALVGIGAFVYQTGQNNQTIATENVQNAAAVQAGSCCSTRSTAAAATDSCCQGDPAVAATKSECCGKCASATETVSTAKKAEGCCGGCAAKTEAVSTAKKAEGCCGGCKSAEGTTEVSTGAASCPACPAAGVCPAGQTTEVSATKAGSCCAQSNTETVTKTENGSK